MELEIKPPKILASDVVFATFSAARILSAPVKSV